MKRKREKLRKLFYLAIVLAFASFLSVCRPLSPVFDPNNEIGVVDFYGFIVNGIVPEDMETEIAGRTVGVVSQGFLYRYWKMQKYLKDNNIEIDEGGSDGNSDDMDRTTFHFRSVDAFKHRSLDHGIQETPNFQERKRISKKYR